MQEVCKKETFATCLPHELSLFWKPCTFLLGRGVNATNTRKIRQNIKYSNCVVSFMGTCSKTSYNTCCNEDLTFQLYLKDEKYDTE